MEFIMSKKSQRRGSRKGRNDHKGFEPIIEDMPIPPTREKSPLEAKTKAQAKYINSININKVTFGIGPAGVGKTYVAARVAADLYRSKQVSKILLTRPAVESGASLGFLKGDLKEKFAPYIKSYGPGFRDGFGEGYLEYLMRTEKIDICPLNFMQGLSWEENVIVLFDEAENATPQEMKMFLTRIGEDARVVIDGDPTQTMIKSKSGLIDGFEKIRYIEEVDSITFTRDDIVRSGLVRAILDAYDVDNNESDVQTDLPGFIQNGIDRK